MPFTETVLVYRRVGARPGGGLHLVQPGVRGAPGGDPARARKLVEQSVADFQRLDDLHGEGLALCHLANLHRLAGELPEAGELLEPEPGDPAPPG